MVQQQPFTFNEYSGLISFGIDRFDLLAVQWTFRSLLQHHILKASIFQYSVFFMALESGRVTFGTGKDSDARRDWEQEEKGMTEDEMAGWHYRLDGREFECGTLIPSAQRLVWAAKQALGEAALGALFA